MSVEHFHHFGLAEDPFRNDHHDKFHVESASQTLALQRLDRGVRQAKGLVVLTGGVGTGKTLIARRLYEELEEEVFEASMMVVLRSRADSEWLLTRFASQLGVDAPAGERETLINQIYERLAIIREDGRHAILIVDDAQALASIDTLREVSGLVKLEYEERRVLSIVLVGARPLEEAFASDRSLAQHVEVKVTLNSFERDETEQYLAERIQRADGNPQILHPGAIAGLHELSGGSPGLINTLVDNALFEAFLEGRKQVTHSDVESAHAALGWARAGAAARPAPARGSVAGAAIPSGCDLGLGVSSGIASAESTQIMQGVPVAAPGSVTDLDSQLDAAFATDAAAADPADAGQTMLMGFDQRPPASATQVVEPPPKENDEVDELFMELIDE